VTGRAITAPRDQLVQQLQRFDPTAPRRAHVRRPNVEVTWLPPPSSFSKTMRVEGRWLIGRAGLTTLSSFPGNQQAAYSAVLNFYPGIPSSSWRKNEHPPAVEAEHKQGVETGRRVATQTCRSPQCLGRWLRRKVPQVGEGTLDATVIQRPTRGLADRAELDSSPGCGGAPHNGWPCHRRTNRGSLFRFWASRTP